MSDYKDILSCTVYLSVWAPGYLCGWVFGCLCVWVSGCLGVWVPVYMDILVRHIRIPDYQQCICTKYLGILGYLSTKVNGYLGIWIFLEQGI